MLAAAKASRALGCGATLPGAFLDSISESIGDASLEYIYHCLGAVSISGKTLPQDTISLALRQLHASLTSSGSFANGSSKEKTSADAAGMAYLAVAFAEQLAKGTFATEDSQYIDEIVASVPKLFEQMEATDA
eukprot:11892608-Ditylum_brightwellii.AAC.1